MPDRCTPGRDGGHVRPSRGARVARRWRDRRRSSSRSSRSCSGCRRSSPSRSLVFDDGVFGVVGAGDARRRGAVPRHLLEPGPAVPPAGVGRRPRRVPHARRAARCSRSPPACCVTVAIYSCARRVTTRGERAARRRAGHDERLGPLGDRPGQRRRPVARAVGARGRARAALPRRPATRAPRSWVGLAARRARCRSRRCRCPAVVIAGLVVLLLAPAACVRRAPAAVVAGVGGVRGGRGCRGASTGCGTSRSRTTTTRVRQETRRWARSARSSTRCGTATCLVLVALAAGAGHRSLVRVRGAPRVPAGRRPTARSAIVVAGARALGRARGRRCSSGSRRCGAPHVAHLVPPLALLAALRPPPWTVLLVAALVVGRRSGSVQQPVDILWPDGYSGAEAALVQRLRALPADALVISDDPGLAWRAGHAPARARSPTRRSSASTQGDITAALARRRGGVRRRVRRSSSRRPQHFGRFDGLGDAARGRGLPRRSASAHHRLTSRCYARAAACDPSVRCVHAPEAVEASAAVAPRRSPG